MIELADVLDAVRHDTAGPRLGRIRDVAPAVEAARAAEAGAEGEPEGQDGERSGGEGVRLADATHRVSR